MALATSRLSFATSADGNFHVSGAGAREVYDSSAHNFSLWREKFFVLGDVWVAAMEGEPLSARSYQHVAFSVDDTDLSDYQARIEAIDVEIRAPRERVDGEGQSLYFYDFDNHLFELHTGTLEQRLSRYSAQVANQAFEADGSAAASHSTHSCLVKRSLTIHWSGSATPPTEFGR